MTRSVVLSSAAALSGWRRRPPQAAVPDVEQDNSSSRRPLLHVETPHTPAQYIRTYGTLHQNVEPIAESSSSQVPEDVIEDDLDEEEEEEWELEQEGLYRGSYRRIVTLYAFVPLSTSILFLILALIPSIALPIQLPPSPRPRHFNTPLSEALAAAGLWSLSHQLRLPIYSICSLLRSSTLATLLSTILHVLIHNLLRLSTLPILKVRHGMDYPMPTWRDWAFRRVWWLALGWCFAEAVVGIAQGYEQLALYRTVLVPEGLVEEVLRDGTGDGVANGKKPLPVREDSEELSPQTITGRAGTSANGPSMSALGLVEMSGQGDYRPPADTAIMLQVDRDLDYLIALNEREKIEEVYGVPFIKIPVFVSCLQRISSVILSMGLTLILSSSYLRSSLSRPLSTIPSLSQAPSYNFYITFPIVLFIHASLSTLHTPLILPRIGVHTAAYVGLLVGLGCLFAGLGMWDVL